jgi:putative ABC transport system permease protein
MDLVAAVAVLLRRLRAERGIMAVVFIVVAVTAFTVAAGPRLYARVSDDGLRYEVSQGTVIQRNMQFAMSSRISPGRGDPLAVVAARGDALRTTLPESVDSLIDGMDYVVDSVRFRRGLATYVTLRIQPDLDGLVQLVDGRWPASVEPGPTTATDMPPRFEAAVSEAAAEALQVAVGDSMPLEIDPVDPYLRYRDDLPVADIELVISGIYTVADTTDRRWFGDQRLWQATVVGTEQVQIIYSTLLLSPDAYPDLYLTKLPNLYRWNLFIDGDRIDAGDLDTLEEDLVRLRATYPSTGSAVDEAVTMQTGLPGAIRRYRVQRATTETALSLAAIGPLAVAAGAVALLSILVVRRRRGALYLARGRGASGGQLLATQLWEGLLVTVPAALVGLALATVLIDAPNSDLSSSGAIMVATVATALLLLATVPVVRRARRISERYQPPIFHISARRFVFEALIIGLSLSAVWLLRERGLRAADPAGALPGFDPFVAAAPVLVGLAVGLLLIRLFPVPVRGLGWVTARRSDLVPVLGLRSLGRHPSAGYLPLLVLTVTIAIGTLSVVMATSLVHDQLVASWRAVGADYRVEAPDGGALDERLALSSIPGVEAVAPTLVAGSAFLTTSLGRRQQVELQAVDPDRHQAIVAGSPVAVTLPAALSARPAGPESGTTGHPIPAIVSVRPGPGGLTLAEGDRFFVTLHGQRFNFRVAGHLEMFPGIREDASFVVAPLSWILAGWHGTLPSPTAILVRGGPQVGDGLRAAVAGSAGTSVVSRHDQFAEMRDAPLAAAVIVGFGLAVGIAVAYAALAVVTVVVLEAERRSREVAFMRTLGLTGRQIGSLTIIEQGIPLLLALVVGVGLGLAIMWLIEPGIDHAAFSRTDVAVGIQIDGPVIGAVGLLIVAIVVVALAASLWVVRRRDIGSALRMGE